MNKITIILFSLFLILFFDGCGEKINYYSPTRTSEIVSYKNFVYDKIKESFVGESMIREKNYHINKYSSSAMTPNIDFVMYNDFAELRGFKDKSYKILGTTVIDNQTYKVLNYTEKPASIYVDYKFLIDNNNKLHYNIRPLRYDFHIKPKDVFFEFTDDEKSYVEKSGPYTNYEIVFSGITKDTIRLLYREYTMDDLARSSFFQDLTYPINSKLIRFKNLKIEILQINGEKIKFKVLNDNKSITN